MKQPGLKKTFYDPRDFSHDKTFGAASVILPDEYFAGRPKVLCQYVSMFCTAFATCVASACQEGVDFCAEWFFAQEKALTGHALDEGEDLRAPMNTAVKAGFLPLRPNQQSLADHDPAYLADISHWPYQDSVDASAYKKKGYFNVKGDFDAVKQALYQHRQFKRAIVTGVQWYNEWTMVQGGIVPTFYISAGGLHCICIIGFTKKDGVEYLVVQDSDGEIVGDRGLFYFNKTVFNREFDQPLFMLIDYGQDVAPKPIGNWFVIFIFKFLKELMS